MSRSFRHSESFADTRAAFADRKAARKARAAEFSALGYDDDESEALAARPMHRPADREAVRRSGW